MSSNGRRGRIFVLSAPSGTGKTTVARALARRLPGVGISRSYTTRQPRGQEKRGVDYEYISVEQFVGMRDAGGFLEWAQVFQGDYYGTGLADTERRLEAGEDLFLVIDVQGAGKLRAAGVPFVGIFLLPPSFHELEQRLRSRDDVTEEKLQKRLATACKEIGSAGDYDYVVINDDREVCVEQLATIVLAQRNRFDAMKGEVERICASFSRR